MKTVYKMHYLKTHLSKLVDQVDAGRSLVFGVDGKPQYVISKYTPPQGKRHGFGLLKKQAAGTVATNLGGWTDKELEQFESKDPNISA
jgi:antitoxin (DNA-binding transcriptional repressor) of toxin-antitoxin stability system